MREAGSFVSIARPGNAVVAVGIAVFYQSCCSTHPLPLQSDVTLSCYC